MSAESGKCQKRQMMIFKAFLKKNNCQLGNYGSVVKKKAVVDSADEMSCFLSLMDASTWKQIWFAFTTCDSRYSITLC